MKPTYRVIYLGALRPGFERREVVRSLAQALGKSRLEIAETLTDSEAVWFSGLEAEKAKYYGEFYRRRGVDVSVEQDPLAAEAPADDARFKGLAPLPLEFTGNGWEYFRIWIVNLVLTVLTLGIYSPWAKVRRKQYFYRHTKLDGVSLDYTADPKKILKGWMLAMACFVVYQVVIRFLPVASLFLGAALILVLPWVVVRGLAFTARYSSYRGIFFRFQATYGQAFMAFLVWPFLGLLTLGVLSPLAYQRQEKFRVDHFSYGTTPFRFQGKPGPYYRAAGLGLLIAVVSTVILFMVGLVMAMLLGGSKNLFKTTGVWPLQVSILVVYFYLAAFLMAKGFNIRFNNTRLEGHGFMAGLSPNGYFWLLLSNTLASAVTLGFFIPWAKVRSSRYTLDRLALLPAGPLDGFAAAQRESPSAVGDQAADIFDVDLGL